MYSYGWAPQTQRDQKFAGPSQELRVAVTAPPPPNSTGDGTAVDDGWGVFSGTSAAAPQLAGVCALLLAKNQSLTPADVKAVLRRSVTLILRATMTEILCKPDPATMVLRAPVWSMRLRRGNRSSK